MVSLFFVFLFFSDTPIYGFADDYVFMIRGLLDLYEASLDDQWLEWAVELQAKLDETLWDSEGAGYFMGTPGDPSILVRMKEGKKVCFLTEISCLHNMFKVANFPKKICDIEQQA